MNITIHPNMKEYLRKKAESQKQDDLVKILTQETFSKTELDKIKGKFKIKNYGIFFSSIPPEDEDLSKFRTQEEPSLWVQSQIQRVTDSRLVYLDILESLGEDGEIIDYKQMFQDILPISLESDSQYVAKQVRRLFDSFVGNSKIENARKFFNNLALFIETQGILVFSTTINAHESSFSGCAIAKPTYPVILVSGASPVRENFTLLHELGHILLDSDNEIDFRLQDSVYKNKDMIDEMWCNRFAAQFLLYEDVSDSNISSYSGIKQIGKKYFASLPVVIYHLYSQGLLSNESKDRFLKEHKQNTDAMKTSSGTASPYQSLLSNSISNAQLLLHAHQNALIDNRLLYQTWAGNRYAISKVFTQLIEQSYL